MDERSEREAFEPWFQRIEDGDGEIPAPQSIADPGWSEYVQRHSIAWAAWQERARRPEPNHGPEALTTAGLLSALEADTLTGTQRAALAAMIRGRPVWQPIETCPQDGFFLLHEDEAIRLKLRINGVWHGCALPAIVSEWGDHIVGDDAARMVGGRRLIDADSCCSEPTHWMPLPSLPHPAGAMPDAQGGE